MCAHPFTVLFFFIYKIFSAFFVVYTALLKICLFYYLSENYIMNKNNKRCFQGIILLIIKSWFF